MKVKNKVLRGSFKLKAPYMTRPNFDSGIKIKVCPYQKLTLITFIVLFLKFHKNHLDGYYINCIGPLVKLVFIEYSDFI
jgi:hypothetical protein